MNEQRSERSEARKQSECGRARKQVSGASKRENGQAGGTVLTFGLLVILAHSAMGGPRVDRASSSKTYDRCNEDYR